VNVVIVGSFWFPHGAASGARVRNLALGLRECGARVHVIGTVPQPRPDGDGPRTLCPGISYEYAAPMQAAVDGWRDQERTVPRLRRRLVDKVRWFAGLYASTPPACRLLADRIERDECDLVVVYDRSLVRIAPLSRTCRARGVTVLLDVVEGSEQQRNRGLNLLYWDFAAGARATPRLFDGITVISEALQSLYRSLGCAHTLVVPSIEAWPPAAPLPATGNAEFRLAYVGALQERDAPGILLDAMRVLAHRRAPVVLDLIGHYEGTAQGRRFREECASDPVLASRVRFRGSLSDEGLRAALASADGLVLTRRDARTEELSFPTRLVEYLRHGRPVFVSDVGDVGRYLRDGVDAVLLHPRDPMLVAGGVEEVARRPDRGAEIGVRGREAGARSFDRRVHAGRLLEFAARLPRRSAA
jgi:glycosyltransferase involved in cell wall biosynthesis